jgi:hypothetical protein
VTCCPHITNRRSWHGPIIVSDEDEAVEGKLDPKDIIVCSCGRETEEVVGKVVARLSNERRKGMSGIGLGAMARCGDKVVGEGC